ncbi:MAG: hypothetical protein ACI8S3_000639 [Alphaproteobacteria bacterium]|jgi:hypothetical protein
MPKHTGDFGCRGADLVELYGVPADFVGDSSGSVYFLIERSIRNRFRRRRLWHFAGAVRLGKDDVMP